VKSDRPTPVVIDCDPGHDDALAILLAASHPALDLRAITTVAGNQTLDKTTLNARRLCTVAGITEVPIAAGCDRPLAGPLRTAGDVHGETGMDGPRFGRPTVDAVDIHAVELIHRVLGDAEHPVTLIATGPLTNVASLLRRFPADRHRIERMVLMGGSTERGNTTPYAEFNIIVDPEAADEVLRSGLPTTWLGLNVTHQATATSEVIARITALGTPLAEICVELLTFFGDTYRQVFGFPAPPVHDPVAVAQVIDPSLIATRHVPMRIELLGEHTRGATVVDLAGRSGWEPNATVGTALDAGRFWELMVGAIDDLGRRSGPVDWREARASRDV
jgi:purine nucleosidase